MVQINFARKEINCKIVYYGPGLSGKTTSLEVVHQRTPQGHKGELTSISTDGDRTLFFDFMPLDLGTIAGMKVKFHLYTVPGQVYYNSTRKLVLLGADGIIFVADSTPGRMDDNNQSMENLRENLMEMGRDLNKLPLVIQYNKRDLPSPIPLAELEAKLNPNKVPTFETSAKTGEGIFQALKAISALVLEDINSNEKKIGGGGLAGAGRRMSAGAAPAAPRPAPAPVAAAAPDGGGAGMLPARESAKVLRPAGGRSLVAAAAVQAPPAAAPPARESKAKAPAALREPAPMRELAPERDDEQEPAPAPRAPARAPVVEPRTQRKSAPMARRPAPREEHAAAEPAARAHAPAASGGSGAKMFVFMVLGILAGAAAAVFAVKFLLKI
jgi:signal recognition particle receptor subunit beta